MLFILTFFLVGTHPQLIPVLEYISGLLWVFPFKPEISLHFTRFGASSCLWNISKIGISFVPLTLLCHAKCSYNGSCNSFSLRISAILSSFKSSLHNAIKDLTKIEKNANNLYHWQTYHSLIWTVNQFMRRVHLINSKLYLEADYFHHKSPVYWYLSYQHWKYERLSLPWSNLVNLILFYEMVHMLWNGTHAEQGMTFLIPMKDKRGALT